jgi:GGDEF domain-containing protein
VPIGASIGVAAFPGDGRTVGELIAAADANLYRTKRAGLELRAGSELGFGAEPLSVVESDGAAAELRRSQVLPAAGT